MLLFAACDTGPYPVAVGPAAGGDSDMPRATLRFCKQFSQCNPASFDEHFSAPAECAADLAWQLERSVSGAKDGDACKAAFIVFHDCVSEMECGKYLSYRDDVNGRVPNRACWEYSRTMVDVCK